MAEAPDLRSVAFGSVRLGTAGLHLLRSASCVRCRTPARSPEQDPGSNVRIRNPSSSVVRGLRGMACQPGVDESVPSAGTAGRVYAACSSLGTCQRGVQVDRRAGDAVGGVHAWTMNHLAVLPRLGELRPAEQRGPTPAGRTQCRKVRLASYAYACSTAQTLAMTLALALINSGDVACDEP